MNTRRIGCLVLALFLVGCSEPVDPNRETTAPASGTVTYDGAAVEGATVTFMATGGAGRGAVATTDASGEFSMTTYEPGDGVIPGAYKVVIMKTTIEGGLTEEEMENWDGGGEPPQGTEVNHLPVKYNSPADSGLTAEISDAGATDLKFELTGELEAPKAVTAADEPTEE